MDLSGDGAALTVAVAGRLPESVRIAAHGLDLHALVWGGARDPTAILVHGNGAHAHWWDALVPALVPPWRLVAPDLRGHGESAWPATPAYRLEQYLGDLEAVMDAAAPGPIVLVGHSMGGRIALAMAAARPERIRALVIVDSRLERVRPELAAQWRGRLAGTRQGRGYPTRAAAMNAFRFVPEEQGVSASVVADLAFHAVHERGPEDWTFRFDRAVLSLDGDGARDLLDRARVIRCPALVIAGATSWVMDPDQRAQMATAMPHADIRVLAGGHHVLLAQPEAVGVAIRDFIAKLLPLGGTGR